MVHPPDSTSDRAYRQFQDHRHSAPCDPDDDPELKRELEGPITAMKFAGMIVVAAIAFVLLGGYGIWVWITHHAHH